MRHLMAGERADLWALDRQLVQELRVRVRGEAVTGHLPPDCRIWLIGQSADAPAQLLASGPASATSQPAGPFSGESGVPGVILRLPAWTGPDSARLLIGVTWQNTPGTPPFLTEFRTAQRVAATAKPPPLPAARPGGLLVGELYRRREQWRLWVRSEWLGADGLSQLEQLSRLPPGTLHRPGRSAAPSPTLRGPGPAAPAAPAPGPAARTPAPIPPAVTSASPPPAGPTGHPPSHPTGEVVAPAEAPAPLGRRLTGLWDRLLGGPAQGAAAPAPAPANSGAAPVASPLPGPRLPPRTAQSFARTKARLESLEQLLAEKQSDAGLSTDTVRWRARLSTLHTTFATLQSEALELERQQAQARSLGIDPPPAAQRLEGELERAYRQLETALAELAGAALEALAADSRERLERESLFLSSLKEDRDLGP
ncbi:MAG: hypothetical protein Q4C67_05625 [Deinococcus sp.]|nr:hypothetical protein [Deinococcus sp.]